MGNEAKTAGVFSSAQMSQESKVVLQEAKEVKKKPIRAILGGLWAVAVFLLIQVVVSAGTSTVFVTSFMQTYTGTAEEMTQAYTEYLSSNGIMTGILTASTLLSAIVAGIWYKLGYVKKITDEKKQTIRACMHGKSIAIYVLVGIGAYCLAILIAGVVAAVSPSTMETFNDLMGTVLGGSELLALAITIILAPIAEEILLRGVIFNKLAKNMSIPAAIIIQALLFSLYHMNLMQAIYVLPLGLILGYTAYKTKSVIPCILIHAVNNIMPQIFVQLPEVLQSIFSIIVIAGVCFGLVYVLTNPKKNVEAHV